MQKQQLDGKSMDIVSNNIDKLKQIFPDVFSEGQINFEKLQAVLGGHICEDEEHYKFTWHGKKKAEHEATKTRSTGTLRPVKADSKNWDSTNNVFIEGDNLEVLKLLQKSYHNKIKMIYIDPPYNTGKDFLYKDNYKDTLGNYKKITGQVDGEGMAISSNTDKSGRYHTDWLNMMYPRLKLARNLLKDDGVIFISIDDNEQANLKKMCDEVFGEDNFVGLFTVENNPKGRKNSKYISVTSDYCFIYAKNTGEKNSMFIESIPKKESDLEQDENGIYIHKSGKRVLVGENSFNNLVSNIKSDKHYKVLYNSEIKDIKIVNVDNVDFLDGYKIYESKRNGKHIENTYTSEKLLNLFNKNALIFKDKIFEKNFNTLTRIKSVLTNQKYDGIKENKITKIDLDFKTTSSSQALQRLFDDIKDMFSHPKNVTFLKVLLNLIEEKDYLVLDFFAGSGTTGDAVMQLNAEDGGNRKYICVQLDEPISEKDNKEAFNFCTENDFKPVISSITKERLSRAGDKIVADAKKELAELLAKARPDQEKVKLAQQKLAKITGCHSVLDTESPNYNEMPSQAEHFGTLKNGLDIGFKAFKLDTSNIKPWDGKIESFGQLQLDAVDNIKQSRSTDDVLFEILLKLGLDLTVPITEIDCNGSTLYNIGMGALLVCIDSINDEVIANIIQLKKEYELDDTVVVFTDKSFEDDVAKTNYSQQLQSAGINNVHVV